MQINEIIEKIKQVKEEYKKAREQENVARSICTDALNRLNELQKTFDKEIEKFKKEMPDNSDWKSKLSK